MRFLFLHAVAQAAADGPPEPYFPQASQGVNEEEVKVPQEISTPFELAKWALQQAAKKMQSSQRLHAARKGSPVPRDGVFARKVLFAWEHPRDPEEYIVVLWHRVVSNHRGGHSPNGMHSGSFMGCIWRLSIRVAWDTVVPNPQAWVPVVGGCLKLYTQSS